MVELLHGIRVETDDQGNVLPSCCLAGPDGEAPRRSLSEEAQLVHAFPAGSHFEAMTICHRLFDLGPFTVEYEWDYQPYLDEWRRRQQLRR
ncbi:MAG: hypothetical protein JSR91_05710 [Proteobacteria bacterium]|nr:hypothetical protein [Pseudomonadota bacterium]